MKGKKKRASSASPQIQDRGESPLSFSSFNPGIREVGGEKAVNKRPSHPRGKRRKKGYKRSSISLGAGEGGEKGGRSARRQTLAVRNRGRKRSKNSAPLLFSLTTRGLSREKGGKKKEMRDFRYCSIYLTFRDKEE